MDEKKVREAIYCIKANIGEAICEECVNYYIGSDSGNLNKPIPEKNL